MMRGRDSAEARGAGRRRLHGPNERTKERTHAGRLTLLTHPLAENQLTEPLKASELRKKGEDELKAKLEELKEKLASLRVSKVVGGAPAKVAQIKTKRKDIARVLTVLNQNNRAAARAESEGQKFKNLDVRMKKTRAIRRRLNKSQLYVRVSAQPLTDKSGKASKKYIRRKTPRALKREANFPMRVYALKAV